MSYEGKLRHDMCLNDKIFWNSGNIRYLTNHARTKYFYDKIFMIKYFLLCEYYHILLCSTYRFLKYVLLKSCDFAHNNGSWFSTTK